MVLECIHIKQEVVGKQETQGKILESSLKRKERDGEGEKEKLVCYVQKSKLYK